MYLKKLPINVLHQTVKTVLDIRCRLVGHGVRVHLHNGSPWPEENMKISHLHIIYYKCHPFEVKTTKSAGDRHKNADPDVNPNQNIYMD